MSRKKANETYKGVGRCKTSGERVYMTPVTDFIFVGEKTLNEY